MSKRSSIFLVFSVLIGLLLFAIWSNILVYGQQPSSPPPGPRGPDSANTNKISAQLKAKMCDPSNPSLKVVNTTEARICDIPKTVKNTTTTTATPPTSSVSSSTPQQTVTTKPTSVATVSTPPPKNEQPTNTTNNTNATSRLTEVATGAKISPVNHLTNGSSSSPLGIAPQIKAVNQQQPSSPPPPPLTGIHSTTGSNSTAGQNYTFAAAASPVATSDKLLYLGYHDTASPTHENSGSQDKDKDTPDSEHRTPSSTKSISGNGSLKGKSSSSDAKPSIPPHIKITAPDNDASSKEKTKKTSSTTLDKTDSASDDESDAKPSLRVVGSFSDGSSASKKKTSTKVDITPTNDDDNSKEKKSNSNRELPTYDTRGSTTSDSSDSTGKKKTTTTDVTKSDRTYSASDDGKDSEDKSSNSVTSLSNHHNKHSTVTDDGSTGKRNKNTDTTKLDTTPTMNEDSSSTDMSTSTATDDDSTAKSAAGSYITTDNSGSIDSGNSNPNFSTSTNDGSILSPSYLASSIKNKVESIIRNSMGGIIDKTPFILPFH
jgi:hypothetical protein